MTLNIFRKALRSGENTRSPNITDKEALILAQEAFLRKGITGIHDAGFSVYDIELPQEIKEGTSVNKLHPFE